MSTMTIIDNEFATLKYYPETKIVHHVFHKPIFGAAFREVLDEGIELLKKYGAQKWLSDDRQNMALPPDDSEWAKIDWFSRAAEAGWKYWALVVPPYDLMAQQNYNEFIDNVFEQGVRTMVFTEPESALAWLKDVS